MDVPLTMFEDLSTQLFLLAQCKDSWNSPFLQEPSTRLDWDLKKVVREMG